MPTSEVMSMHLPMPLDRKEPIMHHVIESHTYIIIWITNVHPFHDINGVEQSVILID